MKKSIIIGTIILAAIITGIAGGYCYEAFVNREEPSKEIPKEENNKENSTPKDNSSAYDTTNFIEININEFPNIYAQKEKSVIFIGRSTCPPCRDFLNELRIVQDEYNLEIYYLSLLGADTNSTDYKNIKKLDSYLDDNFGRTPMLVIAEDNKLIKGTVGSASNDVIFNFLKQYKVIK